MNGFSNLFGYPKGGPLTFCEKYGRLSGERENQDFFILKIKNCKVEGDIKIIKNFNGEFIFAKRVFSTIPIRRNGELFLDRKSQDYKNIGGIILVLFHVKDKKLEEKIFHEYVNDFSDDAKFFGSWCSRY